ncbi:hypothetical protein [Clostridium sp. E02]|uniref:hypothetical protein n=1 Tax=Clostridium sp. E02 TaxID=2487134 RepID=UPI000F53BA45|nr:hypothetical protein [Clostridium sp. E02]
MKVIDLLDIQKIENAFGFSLYDWQKDYLLGKRNIRMGGRNNGNTLAYCLKLLLSDGESIKRRDLYKYRDERHGTHYDSWFAHYLWDINKILVAAGFETRLEK